MAANWPVVWQKTGPINWLLAPLSAVYAVGWEVYLGVYRLGLKRPYQAKVPVLCVGNLRVGGTGKTPFVRALCAWLLERGHRVVVSASGYGSPHEANAQIAPPGPLDSRSWGDEPALLRDALPQVQMIVGRNRVQAAKLAELHFADSILVMDDGFQHLPLKKSATILLRPAPDLNRLCMPAGPYREPAWNYRRANLVIPDSGAIDRQLTLRSTRGSEVGPEQSRTVDAMCAIANPSGLRDALMASGLQVRKFVALSDHDPLSDPDLMAQFEADIPLVVTSKDWVKLRHRNDLASMQIWVADYEVKFSDRLAASLEGLVNQMVKAAAR